MSTSICERIFAKLKNQQPKKNISHEKNIFIKIHSYWLLRKVSARFGTKRAVYKKEQKHISV